MSSSPLGVTVLSASLALLVGSPGIRAQAPAPAPAPTSAPALALAPASAAQPAAAREVWTIGVYTGASPLDLAPLGAASQPVLTGADVTDMPDLRIDTVAHPSLVRADGRLLLFFTAKDLGANKGGIGLAESSDGRRWTFRRTVVREPWVLSGPHVFQADGSYYMVAESYTEPFVRLYRATSFPDQWVHDRDLIAGKTGDQFISPTLLRHDGRWYLFTTPGGNRTLRLHHASDLGGPWTEHPSSPIVRDDLNTARPAGRPFQWKGAPYRLAQDCEPTYGLQVYAFRITTLSPTAYAEEAVASPLVSATGAGWNSTAMHHADLVQQEGGGWLAAVDALGVPPPR